MEHERTPPGRDTISRRPEGPLREPARTPREQEATPPAGEEESVEEGELEPGELQADDELPQTSPYQANGWETHQSR